MSICFSHAFVLAQSLKPAAEQAPEPSLMSPWMMGIVVVAMVLVPFVLGTFIAKSLKLKDLGLKFGVAILTLELGLAPFVAQYVIGAREQSAYRERLAKWEEKQKFRDKITDGGVEDLKKAAPSVEVLRDEEPQDTAPKSE